MQRSSFYVGLMVGLSIMGTVLLFLTFSMGGRISP
jgi:hypothetical protein